MEIRGRKGLLVALVLIGWKQLIRLDFVQLETNEVFCHTDDYNDKQVHVFDLDFLFYYILKVSWFQKQFLVPSNQQDDSSL